MSLLLLRAVVERALVLAVGGVMGSLASLHVLVQLVRLGPRAVFGGKGGTGRGKPPPCLTDPDLGTHGYAHLQDIRMHYVSNGAEDKPLMLLVHGFPEFWYSWRHQLKEFKDSYRVVAMDMRGYGDTDKPSGKGSYKLSLLIEDLRQLIEALGYQECVLVGHDFGGAICWAFAEAYPDMVCRLITMNCPNSRIQDLVFSSLAQFKKSWYMFLFQMPYLPELLVSMNDCDSFSHMLNGEYGITTEFTTVEDIKAYKYTFSRNSLTGPLNYYRAAFSLESLRQQRGGGQGARGVAVPTLIVWGERDMALDRSVAELAAQTCKGKVDIHYIKDATHYVQMDRPDLVNQYIRQFLTE